LKYIKEFILCNYVENMLKLLELLNNYNTTVFQASKFIGVFIFFYMIANSLSNKTALAKH